MTIKLIVCDLDGTLVGTDLSLSRRTIRAVQRARARGIVVTLATGRGYPSARQFAQRLEIGAPLICYQGAQIRSQDGTLLHESTLSRQYLPPVIDYCRQDGWELAAYHDDRVYQTTQMYDRAFYDRWVSLPVHQVTDLMTALPGDPIKYIATAPTSALGDRLERQIRVLAEGTYQVMRSHAWFVEGLAANVSKAFGVAFLARRLGLARSSVMAIGDSENDASMVAWAHIGIAVGNASPNVKAVANVVAPSQELDGAAWAIERYALGEPA